VNPRPLAPALLVAALLGACGAERREVRFADGREAGPTRAIRLPSAGISFRAPRRAPLARQRRGPRVARVTFDEAVVGLFAYRRREQLPRTQAELEAARRRLVAEVRGPDYRLIRSRTTRVDGARAIELVGDQTISRRRVRTRSLHVFRGSGEYVIEMIAPVGTFGRYDRVLFTPLVRSLRLSGKIPRR